MCSRETVKTVGDSLGIVVPNTAADHLKREVECRLQDIITDAVHFMKHAHRTKLTSEDINLALRQRNVEPLYGYTSSDPAAFRQADATGDLFFIEDHVVNFDEVLNADLPPVPLDPYFSAHWLAVDGVQPRIAENPTENYGKEVAAKKTSVIKASTSDAQAKPSVKYSLTKEQQLLLEHVTLAIKGSDDILKKAALKSMRFDGGLNQLVPYLTQFIADEVTHHMLDLPLLRSLMKLARCLLTNPHLHIEPYLHQLMPWILTCLVGRRLCANPLDDHWSLRDYCASLIALVCEKFGDDYRSLQPRITKTLTRALLDPKRPLTTHYGAIVGLQALGQHVTRTLILPHITPYLKLLETVLFRAANPTKRMEATNCYAALLAAAGSFVRREFTEALDTPALYRLLPQLSLPSSNTQSNQNDQNKDHDHPMADSDEPPKKKAKKDKLTKAENGAKKTNGLIESAVVAEEGGDPAMANLSDLFGESLLPYAEVPGLPDHRWDVRTFL